MTEEEWLACDDPELMLDYLTGKVSERKLQLLAVGFCERIWDLLTDARSRSAINALRRFADGNASAEEMEKEVKESLRASSAATSSIWVAMLGRDTAERASRNTAGLYSVGYERAQEVEAAVTADISANAHQAAASAASCVWGTLPQHVPTTHYVLWTAIPAARAVGETKEHIAQCSLIGDIFGSPFRPVAVAPSWLTETVVALAEGIYQERAFDRMPILADALEDVGCDNADILNHCRQPGEHVRGCWVIDLLTGRK